MNKYNKYQDALHSVLSFIPEGLIGTDERLLKELVDKETPTQPEQYSDGFADGHPVIEYSCPTCGQCIEYSDSPIRCWCCGQRLEWSEDNEN